MRLTLQCMQFRVKGPFHITSLYGNRAELNSEQKLIQVVLNGRPKR